MPGVRPTDGPGETGGPRRVAQQFWVRGVVQGVGFRPFVYNLALRQGITGWVRNTSAGLIAEVEGAGAAVDEFLEALVRDAPPLAWIQDIAVTEMALAGGANFVIEPSTSHSGEFALVSPDVATCADFLDDLADSANRRFGYAFTNCTNCGPRYTIVRDIPYDRPNTTENSTKKGKRKRRQRAECIAAKARAPISLKRRDCLMPSSSPAPRCCERKMPPAMHAVLTTTM